MNLVIDNAYEINSSVEKKFIGRLMVKADCIVTICEFSSDDLLIKQNEGI
nr:small nuclear ribonucleoprotein E [Cryptomonas curvata]